MGTTYLWLRQALSSAKLLPDAHGSDIDYNFPIDSSNKPSSLVLLGLGAQIIDPPGLLGDEYS
ncbi:hypothetical protein SISNIDRAFT_460660 [Sistotremastrum niveocremeum HHB9708]|uniref:Uncharacterized protein n=2 Tax=Sistotremastraceae TaxID=3402574 RepID=A0A164NI21_9AGAM|nr:hypothetical protein SISNIDRAFT_460660 [Sistotremastrum niveocremeum HHB9708]KZT35356.1 hypothetical protein SISSUDRAFT_1051521 [Sistotremastrum suecicum HHB10207 ss-3]